MRAEYKGLAIPYDLVREIGSSHKLTCITACTCFGNKPKHISFITNSGNIGDLSTNREGKSHNRYHIQFFGMIQICYERILCTLQKGIICKEIAAGRARERELREHQYTHILAIRLLRQRDVCLAIRFCVSQTHYGSSGGYFNKTIFHKS